MPRTVSLRHRSFVSVVGLLALTPHALAQVGTGPNDQLIGAAGPTTDPQMPRVAYNRMDDEFLAVWAESPEVGVIGGDSEIIGQRIDARSGALLGPPIAISAMGGPGPGFAANPDVAYNILRNEYLVVWGGSHSPGFERQIYTQRIDAATGLEVGLDDARISASLTGHADASPAVAHSPLDDEYLVTWEHMDGAIPVTDLHAQKLDGAGNELPPNDSSLGTPGATRPGSVVYNPFADEYFLTWIQGSQVLGLRINSTTVTGAAPPIPASDLAHDSVVMPLTTDVVFNPATNQYLAVWSGPDDELDSEVREIHGRLIDWDGTLLGVDEFPISDMDNDQFYLDPWVPQAMFHPTANRLVVAWMGVEEELVPGGSDAEVFLQVLDGSTGAEVGVNDLRLSDLGPEGDPAFGAGFPALSDGPALSGIAVFTGFDTVAVGAGGDDLYAQLFALPFPAGESVRIGAPANPNVFAPGVTSGPVISGTWDPVVDHCSFMPGAAFDVAVVSAGSVQIPLDPASSLLVDLTAASYSFVAAPGAPFVIPIPAFALLVGAPAYAQAGSWDGVQFDLTNGLDLVFGTP